MPVTVTEFSLFPFLKERVIPVKIGVDKIVQVYLSVCPSQSDLSFRKICISNEWSELMFFCLVNLTKGN